MLENKSALVNVLSLTVVPYECHMIKEWTNVDFLFDPIVSATSSWSKLRFTAKAIRSCYVVLVVLGRPRFYVTCSTELRRERK